MVIFGCIHKIRFMHFFFFRIVELSVTICIPSWKEAESGAHMEHRPCTSPVHVWQWVERSQGTQLHSLGLVHYIELHYTISHSSQLHVKLVNHKVFAIFQDCNLIFLGVHVCIAVPVCSCSCVIEFLDLRTWMGIKMRKIYLSLTFIGIYWIDTVWQFSVL